jgi:alkyl hydroperoxide reductase subunit AhpC
VTLFGLGLLIVILGANDVDHSLRVETGKANALFFVTDECPIANSYTREIARICADYKSRGVNCVLVYVDPALSDDQARKHAEEYGHGDYPRIVDRRHELVKATGVTITPEVAVINREGKVVYRGRIDDSYAALGELRRPVKSADLRDALDAIVSGRPVERPETQALGCYISDFAVSGKP